MADFVVKTSGYPISKGSVGREERLQYPGPQGNLMDRWAFNDSAEEPFDYYDWFFREMGISSKDCVLDMGCGDGRQLVRLETDPKYSALGAIAVGLDIDEMSFIAATNEAVDKGLEDIIRFIVASMEEVPLPTGSINKTIAAFSAYHAPHVDWAIDEMRRVTAVGGLIGFATNDPGNTPMHRSFHEKIAGFLTRNHFDGQMILPPPTFSGKFNSERAWEVLPKFFKVLKTYRQDTKFVIRSSDPAEEIERRIKLLMYSLMSKKPNYAVKPHDMEHEYPVIIKSNQWLDGFEQVVRPAVMNCLETDGIFEEPIQRSFLILENTPPPSDQIVDEDD